MKFLKLFISVVAVLLLALVGIGLALPGTWEARRSTVVPGDADAVFDYLDSVEGWAAWTPPRSEQHGSVASFLPSTKSSTEVIEPSRLYAHP